MVQARHVHRGVHQHRVSTHRVQRTEGGRAPLARRHPVTNMDLLHAEAGAIHNTATAVLTLAGLFVAISGVLVAALAVPSARRLPARAATPDTAEG